MPLSRFFHDAPLHPHETITLSEEESRHLFVQRIRPGEEITLINGRGDLATARLLKGACCEILSVTHEPPPASTIHLALGLSRLSHLAWTIEKCAELGASALSLFPADRSEKRTLSSTELTRLRSLTISAIKQCGRLYLPTITFTAPLKEWNEAPSPLYFGDLRPSAGAFSQIMLPRKLCFVIGPEGGLSAEEISTLETELHAIGVSLSPYTLRAETAPLVAIIMAQK